MYTNNMQIAKCGYNEELLGRKCHKVRKLLPSVAKILGT